MKLRFVKPATVRMELGDGEWIEIKDRLTFGERERLTSAGLRDLRGKQGSDDMSVQLDWAVFKLEKILIWLVDWSARDENDKPVKVSRDALAKLDQDSAQAIQDAIERHEAELEAEKNAQSGKTSPVPV